MNLRIRPFIFTLIKIISILGLLYYIYFFAIIKPRIEHRRLVNQAKLILTIQKESLVQNKLLYVELAKSDSNSANFVNDKSDLVGNINKSTIEGLNNLSKYPQIPDINTELVKEYPKILIETRRIYEEQEKLLNKVFATKSFEEGVKILKSDEAVDLLTKQTNLILEYQFWIENTDNY